MDSGRHPLNRILQESICRVSGEIVERELIRGYFGFLLDVQNVFTSQTGNSKANLRYYMLESLPFVRELSRPVV